jgi:hypothetical protein
VPEARDTAALRRELWAHDVVALPPVEVSERPAAILRAERDR